MFSDIRCVHGYAVCSRIFGASTGVQCGQVYMVCSRIYCEVTDIEFGHGYTVCDKVTDVLCVHRYTLF